MENLAEQLEEIKNLLSSNAKSNKPLAYSTLLHIQEQSSTSPSLIHSLADSSPTLLSSILFDITEEDEQIAAPALKCLGYMIYHPSLVSKISGDDADTIVNALVNIISTTKIKSVCNLGVWCISIQQFSQSTLKVHFQSLLWAVVHALDNPMGSLSTTFEAIQAVMKLASCSSEMMRNTSNIWAPPLYRRFVSSDKRERDMSERCFQKLRSAICPPPLSLSKVLATDVKKKLILAMKELLKLGLKIPALQAWGWFIRLLGPYASKNKHLINEMLKIPEQTFSDIDPQVQVASLVAWEGLIDAVIPNIIPAFRTNTANEHGVQEAKTSEQNYNRSEADWISKRIKLIMTPLLGIMSSKCDASVYYSCLNTWCYFLHKLDTFVNSTLILKTVWEPIFEVAFLGGPGSKNACLWDCCLELLDCFALARTKNVDDKLNNWVSGQLSTAASGLGPSVSEKCLWNQYPIKWLPWDVRTLDFFLKMNHVLVKNGLMMTGSTEFQSLAFAAAIRIFKSIMKGVGNLLGNKSITYDETMLCLKAILSFIAKMFEDATFKDSETKHQNLLHFVEAVTQNLEPSLLGSPLYKVALDLKCMDKLGSINESGAGSFVGVHIPNYMDMVSPVVYLITAYFDLVATSNHGESESKLIMRGMHGYITFLFSIYDSLEILDAFIGLLYKHVDLTSLNIWAIIVNCLKDYVDNVKDLSLFKSKADNSAYHEVFHLLAYPFVVCSFNQKQLKPAKLSGNLNFSVVSLNSESCLIFKNVIEAWKLLYVSVVNASSQERCFSEGLSSYLNCYLDENTSTLELDAKERNADFNLHYLCGNAVLCVLGQILNLEVCSDGSINEDGGSCKRSRCFANSLGLATRFLRLLCIQADSSNSLIAHSITSRVFAMLVRFVGSLYLKEDILSFVESVSSTLLQWLSSKEIQDENINHQLSLFWGKVLGCLQISQPPMTFDSSFLKLQSYLLEITMDHPNPSISEPTIKFWNSTYGEQVRLDYPQNLLPVLDKLSKIGKINLCKRSLSFSGKSHSTLDIMSAPHMYRVTTRQNSSSKRIELLKHDLNGILHSCSKRKRSELTEHQKEVRRAQQGRARDCNGHGPGIQTYTNIDFSQGNEESQESQDIRDADSILEMLRKAG